MRIYRLEEMTKIKKKVISEIRCKNFNCMTWGHYLNCYQAPDESSDESYLNCYEFRKHLERKYSHFPHNSDQTKGL